MTARGGNVDSTRAAPPLHDALRPVEGGPVPGQSSHDTNARHFLSKSIIDPNVPGTGAPKRRLRVGRSPNGFARRGPKRRHFVAPLCDRPAHEAESTMSSWSTVTCSIVRGQARRHRPTTTCQPRRRQPRRRLGQRCRGQNLTSDQKYLLDSRSVRLVARHAPALPPLADRSAARILLRIRSIFSDSRAVTSANGFAAKILLRIRSIFSIREASPANGFAAKILLRIRSIFSDSRGVTSANDFATKTITPDHG